MKYDYYLVTIPKEVTQDMFKPILSAAELAIDEARERTRIYAMPANWTAKRIGQTPTQHVFKVRRIRNS